MTPLSRVLLTPIQVHLVGIAVAALIATAGYLLAIEPALDERDAAMRRHAESANADRDAVVAEANLRAERRELDARKLRLQSLALHLEPIARTNDRMVRLTQLAESSGLSVASIEPDAPRTQTKHTLVPVRLAGTGSYQAAFNFLAQLKKQFPDTRVDTFTLSASSAAPTSPEPRAQFVCDCTWFAARNASAGDQP